MIGTWVAWMRKHLAPPPPTKLTPAERVLAVLTDVGDSGATIEQLASETELKTSALFEVAWSLEATGTIVSVWDETYLPPRRVYRRRPSTGF